MSTAAAKTRQFGQYCGLARALELIGERWALLVIRDLLVGPRRFSDLQHGLTRIPSNVLSARLQELEAAGVVERKLLPRPSGAVVYELTPYGKELDTVVLSLGRWGAQRLGEPRAEERVTPESLVIALRSTFRPEAARGVNASFELCVGQVVLHAKVRGPKLEVAVGPLPDADVRIETGLALKALMAGEMSVNEAKASGVLRATGPAKLLANFVEIFRI